MSPLNPLNPLTGDVPVPEDPREIDAALRAGRITHRLFPYVEWRYGERGRRFTESDSAWLAWLTRHDEKHVIEQVLWLGSVLSNRGMPRWLLETHLRLMHRELCRKIPAKKTAYGRLMAAAKHLNHIRHTVISEELIEELAAEFAAVCGGTPRRLLLGTGRLIICAVADQQSGISNAVASIYDWLANVNSLRRSDGLRAALTAKQLQRLDEVSFGAKWTASVQSIIKKAEELRIDKPSDRAASTD